MAPRIPRKARDRALASVLLSVGAMSQNRVLRHRASLWALALAGTAATLAACAVAPNDPSEAPDRTEDALASCSIHIHSNTYAGDPDYWGTIAFVNTGSVAVKNPTLSFKVPSG